MFVSVLYLLKLQVMVWLTSRKSLTASAPLHTVFVIVPFMISRYSPVPEVERKANTTTNHANNTICRNQGNIGKKRVDNMEVIARLPSLIS